MGRQCFGALSQASGLGLSFFQSFLQLLLALAEVGLQTLLDGIPRLLAQAAQGFFRPLAELSVLLFEVGGDLTLALLYQVLKLGAHGGQHLVGLLSQVGADLLRITVQAFLGRLRFSQQGVESV